MYNFVVAASVQPNYDDSDPVEKRERERESVNLLVQGGKKREATFDIRITTHGVRAVKNDRNAMEIQVLDSSTSPQEWVTYRYTLA